MSDDVTTALFNSYIALVKVLHKNKAIHIDDLIRELGDSIDFRKQQHLGKPVNNEYLLQIYKSLQEIALALSDAESGKRR
jgi:hypothetical protein